MYKSFESSWWFGYLAGVCAYLTWGLLPIFWKQLSSVGSVEVLAHRMLWGFVCTALLLMLRSEFSQFLALFKDRKTLLFSFIASCLLAFNWLIYLWAVLHDHIIEASLGYFLCPLVIISFGTVFLKESLTRLQKISIGLAVIAVIILSWQTSSIPWVALALAITFGFYSLIHKTRPLPALQNLCLETFWMAPLCVLTMLYLQLQGNLSFLHSSFSLNIYMLMAGVATAFPLVLFGFATSRLKLSTVGILQYIAPLLQLFCGVILYGEEFTTAHKYAFPLIWIALSLYSASLFKNRERKRHALSIESGDLQARAR